MKKEKSIRIKENEISMDSVINRIRDGSFSYNLISPI